MPLENVPDPAPSPTSRPAPGTKPPGTYFEQTRDLPGSLVLVLPLLLIYELGLLLTNGKTINGVDFITVFLAREWGIPGVLAFNALLLLAGIAGLIYLIRERNFRPRVVLLGVLLESTVYALVMGSLILWIMHHIPGLGGKLQTGATALGFSDRIFVSLGAGVNEELVFRLALYTGLAWAIGKFTIKAPAVAAAVVISSVLFSLAHYVGPEAFRLDSFVFRALAGSLFCALFCLRGFAVAVYTHAIYDVYVLVFSG